MDITFTHHTSLALLRAARWDDDLELRATGAMSCPTERIQGEALDNVLDAITPLIGEPSSGSPCWTARSSRQGGSCDARIVEHLRSGVFPEGSYLEIRPKPNGGEAAHLTSGARVLIEGPGLALVSYASFLSGLVRTGAMEEWLAVDNVIALGDELCGSYARSATNPMGGDCAFGLAPVAGRDEIAELLETMPRMSGLTLARRAIGYVADGSASPMETLHRMMETLPPKLAGLSIGRPKMNHRIDPSPQQRKVLSIGDGMRPDLYWEEYGIAIEHDGERGHLTRRRWRNDHERIQDYQVCGIKVFPATFEDVGSVDRLNAFAEKLCHAIAEAGNPGVGKRVRALIRNDRFRARQRELLASLLPPVSDGE